MVYVDERDSATGMFGRGFETSETVGRGVLSTGLAVGLLGSFVEFVPPALNLERVDLGVSLETDRCRAPSEEG